MNQPMKSVAARLVEGFGLVERPYKECGARLEGWRLAQRSTFALVSATNDVREVLEFLSVLTFPATRHVLVPLDGCTAFLDNSTGGSDFHDNVWYFSRHLEARAARVIDSLGRTWTNGRDTEVVTYEARIVGIHDAHGECIRSVACSNDGGRWVFETAGIPHPVEASFDYSARRKKERFTSKALTALLHAYGLPRLDAEHFLSAGDYLLVREDHVSAEWTRRIQERACTREQRDDPAHGYYQRGLGWLEHIDTHAESAVIDFERAVRINPAYEPLVRPHLKLAKEKLESESR
jgi:hypothetical protein